MYKGIILKVTTEYAVVLTDDKNFCKIIFKQGLVPEKKIFFFEEDIIGIADEDNKVYSASRITEWSQKAAASFVMAACLMLFFLFNGMIGLDSYGKGYAAVISVDINPSIELKLNKSGYVIDIDNLNQEAREVSGNYLLGLKADKALSIIIDNAEKKEYLNDEQDTILLAAAVVDYNKAVGLQNQLIEMNLPEEYSYILIPMEKDSAEKAKGKGLSLGRYAVLELTEGSLDEQEIKKMRVKKLVASENVKDKLKQKEKEKKIKIKDKSNKVKDKTNKTKDKTNKTFEMKNLKTIKDPDREAKKGISFFTPESPSVNKNKEQKSRKGLGLLKGNSGGSQLDKIGTWFNEGRGNKKEKESP